MRYKTTGLLTSLTLAFLLASLQADARGSKNKGGMSFQRIATVPNYVNNDDIGDETVSEIIAATADGRTLVYTDGATESIGFIDISNPRHPFSFGTLPVGGEPTSVDVLGNSHALVAVNTSDSFVLPSGKLIVVDIVHRSIVAEHELGGQPDSLKISPDGQYAAIAIENERDEDIEVDGVEGGLPQLPAGFLVIVDIDGDPAGWASRDVDLTGLADYAPDDPEPEFVDINADNEVIVTMQENNHAAIVDLATGTITGDFSFGTNDLVNVDNLEDGLIQLDDSISAVPREPDAVAWVDTGRGDYRIATANEGDLFGGSRGFTIVDRHGTIQYDSGNDFERIAVESGHYPEDRSENKGSEPEAIEFASFGKDDYLFVGSERGSFIAVYEVDRRGDPRFVQVLPGPFGPEGLLAIPGRGLLVASGEEDDPPHGVRSAVMIYELGKGKPGYPELVSAENAAGEPIGWAALSGMVAKPKKPASSRRFGWWKSKRPQRSSRELLAVWDSFYSEGRIFTIDARKTPAVITGELAITGNTVPLDPEGIAAAPDGTYWIASEGNASDTRPNTLLQIDPATGVVMREAGLPDEVLACRAVSAGTTMGSGFEGVAVLPGWFGYRLLVAQQRGWNYTTPECEALDDDPFDVDAAEPAQTRIWIFDPREGSWDHITYMLEPVGTDASWVGLSEITEVGDGSYIVLERDNRTGDFTDLKTLVRVRLRAGADGVIERDEKNVYDLLPDLEASNGWVSDKPEGVAVAGDGKVYVVTDNDGVDGWSGETWFLRLGNARKLFRH